MLESRTDDEVVSQLDDEWSFSCEHSQHSRKRHHGDQRGYSLVLVSCVECAQSGDMVFCNDYVKYFQAENPRIACNSCYNVAYASELYYVLEVLK